VFVSSHTAPPLSPWPFGLIDPKAVAHQSFRLIENGDVELADLGPPRPAQHDLGVDKHDALHFRIGEVVRRLNVF
jgi:hypothetical protein